jgi:hypothetical protein
LTRLKSKLLLYKLSKILLNFVNPNLFIYSGNISVNIISILFLSCFLFIQFISSKLVIESYLSLSFENIAYKVGLILFLFSNNYFSISYISISPWIFIFLNSSSSNTYYFYISFLSFSVCPLSSKFMSIFYLMFFFYYWLLPFFGLLKSYF